MSQAPSMHMHRSVIAFTAAFILALPFTARAQSAEEKAVLAVIEKLFDGMRRGDTASMRATFAPQARMIGVGRQGEVRADAIDSWLASVGRQPAGTVLNERTWAHEAKVDDNVAHAWMQYDFHIGERFSHCGIDAFGLVKTGGAWKIVTVMDTRRTTGCTAPPGK